MNFFSMPFGQNPFNGSFNQWNTPNFGGFGFNQPQPQNWNWNWNQPSPFNWNNGNNFGWNQPGQFNWNSGNNVGWNQSSPFNWNWSNWFPFNASPFMSSWFNSPFSWNGFQNASPFGFATPWWNWNPFAWNTNTVQTNGSSNEQTNTGGNVQPMGFPNPFGFGPFGFVPQQPQAQQDVQQAA